MSDLKLTADVLLECEMANARGGNVWLKALERYGNILLHDAAEARRMELGGGSQLQQSHAWGS